MLLFSLSQAEEPLVLVHIEFNILVVEFVIVPFAILGFITVYSIGIVILVRIVTDFFFFFNFNTYLIFCIGFLFSV